MTSISPFLWFDSQAEEAANFYVSIFPNSSVTWVSPMGASFVLDGLAVNSMNGGPGHPFTDAISLFASAEDQAEIDRLWTALTDGGAEGQCGWLTDRFGVTWQVVPPILGELLADPDPEKAGRTVQAMLGMRKLVIAELQAAHDGA